MTTAYVAEVDTPAGTRYLGKGAKLSKTPTFFPQAPRLKALLTKNAGYTSDTQFKLTRDEHKTVVIMVKDLEMGMAASHATKMSIRQFNELQLGSNGNAPKLPKNTVFKIEYAGAGAGRIRKRYAGGGKFGKTWDAQQHVRAHITANLIRMNEQPATAKSSKAHGTYNGAMVVQIQLGDDGVTVFKVTRVPIAEFYCLNDACKARLAKATQTALSKVNENFSPSPYA